LLVVVCPLNLQGGGIKGTDQNSGEEGLRGLRGIKGTGDRPEFRKFGILLVEGLNF
jgi:hypothetical protein